MQKVEPEIDMILKRPRTPNDQYSCMSKQQIKDIQNKSKPRPVFCDTSFPWSPDRRYYMDRYATSTSQYFMRGQPGSNPHCWLDYYRWQREPPEQHNTSRLGASVPWGPEKQGSRTFSHFDGEDVYRYLTIDVYCRPPTNAMGPVVCKFGRAPDYYNQRKPNKVTWFGSNHVLNSDVLVDIRPKVLEEYKEKWARERQRLLQRRDKWPSYSEYTDCYTLHTCTLPPASILERRKRYAARGQLGKAGAGN